MGSIASRYQVDDQDKTGGKVDKTWPCTKESFQDLPGSEVAS